MKNHVLLLVFFSISINNLCVSQSIEKYRKNIKKAEKFVKEKDNLKAIKSYQEAFKNLTGRAYIKDRYSLVTLFSVENKIDSAFFHLNYLVEGRQKFKDLNLISNDSLLLNLYRDKRWEPLLKKVHENKTEYEKLYNPKLVKELKEVYFLDQHLRSKLDTIERKFGRDSYEYKHTWELIDRYDSINLIQVEKVINDYGWLGRSVVGYEGNAALFLVIQHSNLETQKKYLPIMLEAVKNGKAEPNDVALLQDRVAIGLGEKQIYGSQIGKDLKTNKFYVFPVIEPEKVNERRASMNMQPIESYVKIWGIKWNAKKHADRNDSSNQ